MRGVGVGHMPPPERLSHYVRRRAYIAFVEECPGANTQGATLDVARSNLREAATLVVEANRMFALEDASESDLIRESLKVTA